MIKPNKQTNKQSFQKENANKVPLTIFDRKKPNNASFSRKQTCIYLFESNAIRTCELKGCFNGLAYVTNLLKPMEELLGRTFFILI